MTRAFMPASCTTRAWRSISRGKPSRPCTMTAVHVEASSAGMYQAGMSPFALVMVTSS